MNTNRERLLLTCFGLGSAIGDVTCLTAVPRDLHRLYPGQFDVSVATAHPELWQNNPHVHVMDIGPTVSSVPGYRMISCHYPTVDCSNRLPRHFIEGFHDYLGPALNLNLRCLEFKGDIHLSADERESYPVRDAGGEPVRYWLMISGGKQDYSSKWPVREYMQDVVWRFRDTFGPRVRVVQIGCPGHYHPILDGVINMVGRTNLRDVIQLVYHADGCVGPVTFLNHMAAAVPVKRSAFPIPPSPHPRNPENIKAGPPLRPNVVIAGGREPVQWEQYPGSQYLHTVGQMDCCAHGGCWRSRAQAIGDGDSKDSFHTCLHPVEMKGVAYASCMARIKPEKIFDAIMGYYKGSNSVLKMP